MDIETVFNNIVLTLQGIFLCAWLKKSASYWSGWDYFHCACSVIIGLIILFVLIRKLMSLGQSGWYR